MHVIFCMRGSRKFSQEGGVQIPRRGLTENFNMAKINNLAIPGGGGPDPLSLPLDPPMIWAFMSFKELFLKTRDCHTISKESCRLANRLSYMLDKMQEQSFVILQIVSLNHVH